MRHTGNANMQKVTEESSCTVRAVITEDMVPPETKKIVPGTDFPDDLVYVLYLSYVLSVN